MKNLSLRLHLVASLSPLDLLLFALLLQLRGACLLGVFLLLKELLPASLLLRLHFGQLGLSLLPSLLGRRGLDGSLFEADCCEEVRQTKQTGLTILKKRPTEVQLRILPSSSAVIFACRSETSSCFSLSTEVCRTRARSSFTLPRSLSRLALSEQVC